jgi:hypothetical protein
MKAPTPAWTKFTPSWELVSPSGRLLLQHFEQVIFLFLLPSMVFVLANVLLGDTSHLRHLADLTQRQRLGIAVLGVGALWSLLNFAPSLYFRLQIAGGKNPSLGSCYRRGLPHFWRLVGLNLILGILLAIGFILLIVPGLILLYLFIKRYYLVNYYVVDRRLGILQALRESHRETAEIGGVIWGTIGVQFTFSFLAAALSLLTYVGVVTAVFLQLVCACLPALRYREVKRAQPKIA